MSNWNIAGGADDTITNGLPTNVDNDQGTIRAAGSVAAVEKFSSDSVSLGESRVITLVSGVNNVAVNPAGAFNGGDQVIRRVTDDLAGVSNDALLSGGSNSANRPFSINQMTTLSTFMYKTAVRSGGWHEYSGVFSPAVTVANTGVWDIAGDVDTSATIASSGTDNAANPSAAVPGEFQYRDGSPEPIQDEYKARELW